MATKTLTLPTRALVVGTAKACLLRLNDDMKFWYPRYLLRHDRHGYHLHLPPAMVVEIQHRNTRQSCLATELPELYRFTPPPAGPAGLDDAANRHLLSIARE